MRIAILLGVSQYECLQPLHAVENDVAGMERLLRATERYEALLSLSGYLHAEETKRKVIAFLDSYRGRHLDEVFVYYSGHGDHVDNVLTFPMSDWREGERRRSSLKNDELDRWIKELRPSVAVKVLDCCYAGVPYIKSLDDLDKALHASGASFRNCYFYFSSRHDQVSRVGSGHGALSVFTDHFLKAVAAQRDGEIRYQQLVDTLADSLAEQDQEPQFVTQGNAKHIFCCVDSQLRRAINLQQTEVRAETPRDEQEPTRHLLEAVQTDAGRFIAEEQAHATLLNIRSRIEQIAFNTQLQAFYDLILRFAAGSELDSDVAGDVAIGKWLKTRGKDFFGWPTESQRSQPDPVSNLRWWSSREPIITGFATTSGLEYDRILASASPKFPNLSRWEFATLFLWSPRELAVFTSTVSPRRVHWDLYDEPEEVHWRRRHFPRKQLSEVPGHVETLVRNFWTTVHNHLERDFK